MSVKIAVKVGDGVVFHFPDHEAVRLTVSWTRWGKNAPPENHKETDEAAAHKLAATLRKKVRREVVDRAAELLLQFKSS